MTRVASGLFSTETIPRVVRLRRRRSLCENDALRFLVAREETSAVLIVKMRKRRVFAFFSSPVCRYQEDAAFHTGTAASPVGARFLRSKRRATFAGLRFTRPAAVHDY